MTILDCNLHDHIEVACVYSIEVLLTLNNDETITGTPITTKIIKDEGEYLEFRTSIDKELLSISLMSLKSMQANNSNPHFDKINFC